MSWLKDRWQRLQGYSKCPFCKQITFSWEKDYIYHPEEPPILGHWQCYNKDCNARTETASTPWADQIAQQYGHETFLDALRARANDIQEDKTVPHP